MPARAVTEAVYSQRENIDPHGGGIGSIIRRNKDGKENEKVTKRQKNA